MSEQKLALNEYLKTDSDYLRGTIKEGLDSAVTGSFSDGDQQLINSTDSINRTIAIYVTNVKSKNSNLYTALCCVPVYLAVFVLRSNG